MEGNSIISLVKNVLTKLQGLSRTQAIIASVTAVVTVGGVGTGGYLIHDHMQNKPQEAVVADVMIGPEADVGTDDGGEQIPLDVPVDTEVITSEMVEVTEETEAAEAKELYLVGTSIEKDLKIKIQNQKSKVVSGEPFVVSVTPDKKGASATTYEDKDKDGIIYIDKIDAGKYKVELQQVEGYEIKGGSISVTVKDEIEYKKVDVTGEIKKESEVNVSVEDTAVNNVPVESTLTDTVQLLESTVSATTVAKADVDQSNFTNASASSEMNTVTVSKTIHVTPEPPEPGTEAPGPGNSESTEKPPTETQKPTEKPPTETQQPTETQPTETQQPNPQPTETQQPDPQPSESETTSETPGGATDPTTPTDPSQGTDGNGDSTGGAETTQTASVARHGVARVAAKANEPTTKAVTATFSLPKTVTLYNSDNAASNSYTLTLGIKDDNKIIKSVEWGTTNAEWVGLSATTGNSVTLTNKLKTGTVDVNVAATVTYERDDTGATWSERIQTTVYIKNPSDTGTVLKDKAGNTLYVDEKATKPATLKDYASNDKFYTLPKYTGWQTIDGKVYYYNASNQAVTGNQVIGGVMYTFAEDGSMSQSSGSRGIDVSKWQGNIDWGAVATSGISFAIIRVGYRGATTGALIEDPYFRQNIAGATRAGIKVGVYFFTQAVNEAEAIEEASMAVSLISGYKVTYPVFIDTESATNGRANGLDVGTRTAVVQAFCRTVAASGYKAGVYASKSWYNSKLNASGLSNYTIWVAQYNATCTYTGKYNMWQYTSKGSVPGINGNVDMNISYTGY